MQTQQEIIRPVSERYASLKPSTFVDDVSEGEYEIAKFFLGGNISVRLVATAPITKFTQKTINKLIRHLEIDKEELPVDDIKTEKIDDE